MSRKKQIHSKKATQRKVKSLTDDQFMERLRKNNGHMRIERTAGTIGLADPYKLAQLRRLCKEGKIRLARVEVKPENFGSDFVEKHPWVETYSINYTYSGSCSLPAISYYEVTALDINPFKGIKSQIRLTPGVREMLISCKRKTLDKASIIPFYKRSHSSYYDRISLTKTNSSGMYYWPSMFILNIYGTPVDTNITGEEILG